MNGERLITEQVACEYSPHLAALPSCGGRGEVPALARKMMMVMSLVASEHSVSSRRREAQHTREAAKGHRVAAL